MSTQDTYEKIVTILQEVLHLDKEQISAASSFDELGIDSLDKLEIVMKIEEAFGIEIDDQEAAKLSTIQEAVDRVQALRSKHSV